MYLRRLHFTLRRAHITNSRIISDIPPHDLHQRIFFSLHHASGCLLGDKQNINIRQDAVNCLPGFFFSPEVRAVVAVKGNHRSRVLESADQFDRRITGIVAQGKRNAARMKHSGI